MEFAKAALDKKQRLLVSLQRQNGVLSHEDLDIGFCIMARFVSFSFVLSETRSLLSGAEEFFCRLTLPQHNLLAEQQATSKGRHSWPFRLTRATTRAIQRCEEAFVQCSIDPVLAQLSTGKPVELSGTPGVVGITGGHTLSGVMAAQCIDQTHCPTCCPTLNPSFVRGFANKQLRFERVSGLTFF